MPALTDLNLKCVMNLLFTLRIKFHFEHYVPSIPFKPVFKGYNVVVLCLVIC